MVSISSAEMSPYQRLRLMILDGNIGRGEPLVERSIAARLGVSRTPVRETILRLEREGLVRIIGGKGAFVASYTVEDVIEIYQVRQALEPMAARLSCSHLAMAELCSLEEKFKRFETNPLLITNDSAAWLRLGREFHGLYIRNSHNQRLIRIIGGLQDQIDLVRGLGRTISKLASRESALQEHLAILHALKARDPDRAEHAVRTHLQNGLRYRLDGLQSTAKTALPAGSV
jgi:DNA-binding GntR family transcriptional regulator